MWKLGEEIPARASSGAEMRNGGLSGAKGQAHLVFWVLHLHEHAKPRGGRLVLLPLLVIQLCPVVSWREARGAHVRGARGGSRSATARAPRGRLLRAQERC